MTTLFAFTPTTSAPFQFSPVLDGVTYTATVTWNIFGKRWYLNIFTVQNVLVMSKGIGASPNGEDINLLSGYFQSTMVLRDQTQNFEVSS